MQVSDEGVDDIILKDANTKRCSIVRKTVRHIYASHRDTLTEIRTIHRGRPQNADTLAERNKCKCAKKWSVKEGGRKRIDCSGCRFQTGKNYTCCPMEPDRNEIILKVLGFIGDSPTTRASGH